MISIIVCPQRSYPPRISSRQPQSMNQSQLRRWSPFALYTLKADSTSFKTRQRMQTIQSPQMVKYIYLCLFGGGEWTKLNCCL